MATGVVLPEDLIIHILSWLPVKSLLRFKCICKSWRSLLETPTFIAKHLNNNDNDNFHRLFFKRIDRDSRQHFYSLLSKETLEVIADLDFPYLKEDRIHLTDISIAGCCNGIICAYDSAPVGIVLWNPATRELKILPKPNLPRPQDLFESPGGPIVFGFNAKLNRYEVVYLVGLNSPTVKSVYQIEVFDLSTDSWRRSNAVMPPAVMVISFGWPAPYINGYFSWLAMDYICGNEMILSFEISQEVFKTTPVPDICGSEKLYSSAMLTVLHESVALINHPKPGGGMDDMIEVWVLNEYGIKDSWTKLYTLGPLLGVLRPVAFWKNKDLFVETTSGRLALLNVVTLEMKNLHFHRLHSPSVVFYKESLIPLNGISCSDPSVPRKLPPELMSLTWSYGSHQGDADEDHQEVLSK